MPLREILAEVLGVGKKTKAVSQIYQSLVPKLGSEFDVLIHTPVADIVKVSSLEVAFAVDKMRRGDIAIAPGYDGIFGTVRIYKEGEHHDIQQATLFG